MRTMTNAAAAYAAFILAVAAALLAVTTVTDAQSPPPDDSVAWGDYVHSEGIPEVVQRVDLWRPDLPVWPPRVFVWDAGGGFHDRLPRALGAAGGSVGGVLMEPLLEAGIFVASIGKSGADGEAGDDPGEANRGLGAWRPDGHPDWALPSSTTWYDKETGHAIDAIRSLLPCEPHAWAAAGISAGSMTWWTSWAVRTSGVLDAPGGFWLVSLNTPFSYPALLQASCGPPAYVVRSYLPAADGLPAHPLGQSPLATQVAASPGSYLDGPAGVFFGSNFRAARGLVDCDPATGVRDVLPDIHDYAQAAWAFTERCDPDDELWVNFANRTGAAGERLYFGSDVRSSALLAEARRWLLSRLLP